MAEELISKIPNDGTECRVYPGGDGRGCASVFIVTGMTLQRSTRGNDTYHEILQGDLINLVECPAWLGFFIEAQYPQARRYITSGERLHDAFKAWESLNVVPR
jgi:hypothetical protein